MKDKINIILIPLIAFETCVLAITVYLLANKVQTIEENQKRINEYILDRIGG